MTLPGSAHACRRRLAPLALAGALGATTVLAAIVMTASPAAANPPMTHDPVGALEHVTALKGGVVRLQGWAADPDSQADATVYALLDGHKVDKTATSVARPSVTRQHDTGPTPGYDFTVPVPATGVHTLCTAVGNIGPGLTRVLGCRATPLGTQLSGTDLAAHSPTGAVTSVRATAKSFEVAGWSLEPDFRAGRMVVVLYVDGAPAATANTHLASAAQLTAGAGKRGAFDITVPVNKGAHNGCVWAVNTGFGYNALLGCTVADTRGGPGTAPLTEPKVNKAVVKEAKKHIGQRYVWGAEGPRKFDCSGLVMYSYSKAGYATPRIAQDQFAAARVIPAARAVPGDLVFYHDSEGAVYHVGIYLKPGVTVAAIDEQEGVAHQTIWDPTTATYGSFTHT
ncbi:MAG TPA: NlpC/P60 family protein [Jatrophihabitantaceae bacterium]|nr:NlpC/P60 family protein [Jatrophihabitantaceae bacterium]